MGFNELSNQGRAILKFSENMKDQNSGFNLSILHEKMNLSLELSEETQYMLDQMNETMKEKCRTLLGSQSRFSEIS